MAEIAECKYYNSGEVYHPCWRFKGLVKCLGYLDCEGYEARKTKKRKEVRDV